MTEFSVGDRVLVPGEVKYVQPHRCGPGSSGRQSSALRSPGGPLSGRPPPTRRDTPMPDEHPQLQAALDLAHADPPISACGWNRPPGVCTCPAWDTVTRLANGGLLAERPCPPPDLPTTLSTPDDVAAVCEAAGLAEIKLAGPEGGHRRWRLDEFQVDADHDGFGMGTGQTWFGNLSYETPTAVLTAAIEAARATGGGDRD